MYAWPFYQPVDVKALNLHDYHDVIKKPMDLSTVQANLDRDLYKTKEEFANDIRLIFENCATVGPFYDGLRNDAIIVVQSTRA